LASITIVLVSVSAAAYVAQLSFLGPNRLARLIRMVDVDEEQSIPTWFSSVGLTLASLLIMLIVHSLRKRRETKFLLRWIILAAGFIILSMDEAVGIHERIGTPTKKLIGSGSGFLEHQWIIPAGILVLAAAAYFLRFLFALEPRRRRQFIMAGAIYVFGALVMESIGGKAASVHGGSHETVAYALCTHIEEACEMIGVVLFNAALIDHLAELNPNGLKLAFTA
jgi:hypothetical protein